MKLTKKPFQQFFLFFLCVVLCLALVVVVVVVVVVAAVKLETCNRRRNYLTNFLPLRKNKEEDLLFLSLSLTHSLLFHETINF